MRSTENDPHQNGFDALLADADDANRTRKQEREFAHLPDAWDAALPFLLDLIARHHEAMLAGDGENVMRLREDAHNLAFKLNGYEAGILADDDAAGCVLDRLTRAPDGTMPLWGQSGSFEITHGSMRVRVEIQGLFGICASVTPWMGFSAHAVATDEPFLSETGYRSFLGAGGDLQAGFTPERYAAQVIAEHVRRELKGRLVSIEPQYRKRPCEP